jgi:hypothetical protein
MPETGEIRAHMEVIGSDGGHVGTVDRLEGDHIRLTRRDDPDRSGAHHHAIPLRSIRMVEGDRVWLTLPAQEARAMAVGGMGPEEMEEGVTSTDSDTEGGADRVSVSNMRGSAGGGTADIHGGGTMAPSEGGADGTAAGYMSSGRGIPHDPNMDPSGRGDPET